MYQEERVVFVLVEELSDVVHVAWREGVDGDVGVQPSNDRQVVHQRDIRDLN